MTVRKRGGSYQADVVRPDGTRMRRSFRSLGEAQSFERLQSSATGETTPTAFGPFVERYFDMIWPDVRRPESCRAQVNVLLRMIGPETPIPSIDRPFIADLVERLKDAKLANATVNRKLSALSKILGYAVERDVITSKPLIKLLGEGAPRERELSHDEEARLLYLLNERPLEGALVAFLLYTGCRLGEAEKLRRIDVEGGYATFRYQTTKTGVTRRQRLSVKAEAAWQTALHLTEAECPFGSIGRGTFRATWNKVREQMQKENDPNFVPHMLRHTCCSRLVRAGVPLYKVMQFMGHRNIQTTMRYSHLIPGDLDAATDALNNL